MCQGNVVYSQCEVFKREGDREAEGGRMKDTWQQKTKTDGPGNCVWEL